MTEIRLTQYSHGGGCGCKIAPSVLSEILSGLPQAGLFPDLMVGLESSDDAAVYRLNDTQAIIATTDFFMPIVDDAFDFGRIAATNALSDIYAMGGQPIMALAVVGMPIDKLPIATIQQIMAGGAAVCQSAGIPIAGGHSIDSPEPIYGLVALGIVHPDKVKRNDKAQADDVLVLGKPIGVGVLSAALKKGELSADGYRQMIEVTTQLNRTGTALSAMEGVHAMTDVTGFAFLGHLLEICRGSQLQALVEFERIPFIDIALQLAQDGYATGAAARNWASYGESVTLESHIAEWQRKLLCDPQTSGGLLVSCKPEAVEEVLAAFNADGFNHAAVIGTMQAGIAQVSVR
ncbi:MAG TPA: selenide, water dikinase SelD [Methylotenera sp.]|nr:selenide, water dikinase SelD [Methylotenera sp.]